MPVPDGPISLNIVFIIVLSFSQWDLMSQSLWGWKLQTHFLMPETKGQTFWKIAQQVCLNKRKNKALWLGCQFKWSSSHVSLELAVWQLYRFNKTIYFQNVITKVIVIKNQPSQVVVMLYLQYGSTYSHVQDPTSKRESMQVILPKWRTVPWKIVIQKLILGSWLIISWKQTLNTVP